MNSVRVRRFVAPLGVAATVAACALVAALLPDARHTAPPVRPALHADVVLSRGGAAYPLDFTSPGGQGLLDMTAWAPGVDWQRRGDEAAIASAAVDGRYVTDVLVPLAAPVHREFQLGDLAAGAHRLNLRFAADRSAPEARQVDLAGIAVHTAAAGSPEYVALAHAPVLYGRSLASYGGAFQNGWTDPPLVAWHYATPLANGDTRLEYQVVWSNEDGGTGTEPSAEQARWGRMTDIEWIYRVEVTPSGQTVPGSETYQAPAHVTSGFAGAHEGAHAVLQTCTDNNNVCDKLADAKIRFFLSYRLTMNPGTQAREQIMDLFPWTYSVMGKEMIREQHTERRPDPATAELSDARDYLYIVIDKTTTPYESATPWVGTSVGVRLRGDRHLYRSDHDIPNWSLQRDGLDATTVELPAGTRMRDVAEIDAIRFPTSVRADPGCTVHVTAITRAYLLDRDYQPEHPVISWHGSVTLTPQHPRAVLWRR